MRGCRRADGPAESSLAGFPGVSSRCAWAGAGSRPAWYELQPVAGAHVQRIEDVGRESDLALSGDFDDHGVTPRLHKVGSFLRTKRKCGWIHRFFEWAVSPCNHAKIRLQESKFGVLSLVSHRETTAWLAPSSDDTSTAVFPNCILRSFMG